MPVRIGELLLKEKRITPEQLQQALNHQKANGGKLGFNLVKMGFVKDEEITALLSKQYGVPSINLAQFDIKAQVVHAQPVPFGYMLLTCAYAALYIGVLLVIATVVFSCRDFK